MCNKVASAILLCFNPATMKSAPSPAVLPPEDLLRNAGVRVTPARVRVLGLLRSAPSPVTHAEMDGALGSDGLPAMDRVTLYRVLDDLVAAGLALKAADGRGIYRFAAAEPGVRHEGHAHFRCTGCGRMFCLDAPPPPVPTLPAGFCLERVILDVSGTCANCSAAGAAA